MAKKNKLSGLIEENNLDIWLCSSGYLFPRDEKELDTFEKLYKNFEFKLKGTIIDYGEIITGEIEHKSKVIDLFSFEKMEIEELRFAARKGEESIPDKILNKMKSKHQTKNGDK
ncbi:MAG: hypothetical protein JXR82_09850 [Marinifilaceae bacterium]|nr:hypothetical protein [Marinifilaceae bacterium]